ncbi:TetR/AcrR family transcriptional regulator [Companilactobacillus furfuricola]|uniref:TetR/AcrR family transcriptional regulator n=1 Tax=Companilactobacillus furfuricola TaxID=1462575 RepID=UPI000F77B388|nr:hypothetical protein [Companilactobacillus furfuricola]
MAAHTLSHEKIVNTAISLVQDQQVVTFSKLGNVLGTRSQSIYNYFKDGDELKAAVAVKYYRDLYAKLQHSLIGLSGKAAVLKYSQVAAEFAIENFFITQYVISMPKWMFHGDQGVRDVLNDSYLLLKRLVDPLAADAEQSLVITRMIRNLISGEVIHIGTGRFKDPLMEASVSFEKMIELALINLSIDN